jgi:hypothetical protein
LVKKQHMESMLFHAGRCSLHEEIDEMIEVTPVKSFNSVRMYRIASSPFFTSDASLDDVVTGKEGANGSLLFDRVATHGGHSTFTILVEEGSDRHKKHFAKLRKAGCVLTHRTFGEFDGLLYSVDVPPGSDFDTIWTILSDGEWSNLFALQERHVVHALSDTYKPPDNSQPVDPEDLERQTQILAALEDSDWSRF